MQNNKILILMVSIPSRKSAVLFYVYMVMFQGAFYTHRVYLYPYSSYSYFFAFLADTSKLIIPETEEAPTIKVQREEGTKRRVVKPAYLDDYV